MSININLIDSRYSFSLNEESFVESMGDKSNVKIVLNLIQDIFNHALADRPPYIKASLPTSIIALPGKILSSSQSSINDLTSIENSDNSRPQTHCFFVERQVQRTLSDKSYLLPPFFELKIGSVSIEKLIAYGSYGQVFEAKLLPHHQPDWINVAVKVNRVSMDVQLNHLRIDSLKKEARILEQIAPYSFQNYCITEVLGKGFLAKSHRFCIVQKLYGASLYELLQKTPARGVSLALLNKFSSQLFELLQLLRKLPKPLIHGDLKPENILLESNNYSKLRVIDFGLALVATPNLRVHKLTTLNYRAPEVILGLALDCSLDIWSVACILFEMHVGEPLFPAKNEKELLVMIFELIGPIKKEILEPISDYNNYFSPISKDSSLYRPRAHLFAERTLTHINRRVFFHNSLSPVTKEGLMSEKLNKLYHTQDCYNSFKDMLLKMLTWDPKKRLTPDQLFEHSHYQKIYKIFINNELNKACS